MSMKYRSDIDGLRTIAVMPVIFYHAGMTLFSGGYVGVDIFFVISGFLITSIIVNDLDKERFTIANFYVRRVKRIFPALYFLLFTVFCLSFFSLMPSHFEGFGKSILSTVLFGSNILFWTESGYFDAQAETKPLLHTWSLGVEEQFYIFFPVILMLICRYGNKKYIRWALGIFIISLGLSIAYTPTHPEAAFYLIPFRSWELMTGALVALGFYPKTEKQSWLSLMSIAGFLMIGYSIFFYDSTTLFPGYHAILPCFGAALIIMADGSVFNRILKFKPIIWIGLLSYSLYLWHWPLFALRNYWSDIQINPFYKSNLFLIILTFIFASFSFFVVERPLRVAKIQRKKLFFSMTAAVMCVGCLVGGYVVYAKGMPKRIPAEAYALANVPASSYKTPKCYELTPEQIANGGLCTVGSKAADKSFILWGDSHALAMSDGINVSANENNRSGYFASTSACAPLPGLGGTEMSKRQECLDATEAVAKKTENDRNIKKIIFVCRWVKYTDTPEKTAVFKRALDAAIKRFSDKQIYFVLDNAEAKFDVPAELAKGALLRHRLPALAPDNSFTIPEKNYTDSNRLLLTLLDRYKNVKNFHVLPLYKALCENGECLTTDGGRSLYYDDDHLSVFGARLSANRNSAMLSEMFR